MVGDLEVIAEVPGTERIERVRNSNKGAAGSGSRERPNKVARPEGFEPPTPCSGGTCSIHLSYGRAQATISSLGGHFACVKAGGCNSLRHVRSRNVFRGFNRACASRSAARAVDIPCARAVAITSRVRS